MNLKLLVQIDPGDIDLLGLNFKDKFYVHLTLPFCFSLLQSIVLKCQILGNLTWGGLCSISAF